MDNFGEQLIEALVWTEEKAESVAKLTKLFKKGVETYMDLSGTQLPSNVASTTMDISADKSAVLDMLAQLWSHLPMNARRDLIDPIRAEANGNEALFVRGIFGQLIQLASMASPVASLGMMVGNVLKNQETILKELETIKGRLKDIEIRLGERDLNDARTAIIHLNDAANVQIQSVRDQNLQLAAGIFTRLTAMDPNQTTQGTSGTMQNSALITLGYWGRHLILGMQGETRYALVQVYECTQKYPLEGMMVFPPAYFRKDYKREIDAARLGEETARRQLVDARRANLNTQIDRGLEIAGGAGMFIVGLGLLLAAGNSSVIQTGLQAISRGAKVYNEASNKPASPFDTVTPYSKAMSLEETRKKLTKEIIAECSERLQLLRRIEVADLRRVIVMPTKNTLNIS